MSAVSRVSFLTGLGSYVMLAQSGAATTKLYPSTRLRARITLLAEFASGCDQIALSPDSLGNTAIVRGAEHSPQCRPVLQQIEPLRSETVALWRYNGPRYEELANVGAPAAIGPDGTAIAIGRRSYVAISEAGRSASLAPFVDGFFPENVVSDSNGNIFSLESRGNTYVAVSVANGATFPIPPLDGTTLLASVDGHAYVVGFTDNKTMFLRLAASGITPFEFNVRRGCSGSDSTALAIDGTLWVSAFAGVTRLDRSGKVLDEIQNVTEIRTITNVCSPVSSHLRIVTDEALWFRCDGRSYRLAPDRTLQYLDTPGDDFAIGTNGAILLKKGERLLRVQPL